MYDRSWWSGSQPIVSVVSVNPRNQIDGEISFWESVFRPKSARSVMSSQFPLNDCLEDSLFGRNWSLTIEATRARFQFTTV